MKNVAFLAAAVMCVVSVSAGSLPTQKNLSKKELQEEVEKLNRRLAQKDSMLSLQQKKVSGLENQLRKVRDSLAIYEFFNDNGIGIFANQSLEKNRRVVQLTGKNKTNYQTIQKIAEVDDLLTQIDTTISLQKKRQAEQGWTDVDLKNAIALEIKAEMAKIEDKLNKIDNCDLSFLSNVQKGFYEKQCARFDAIYNKYLL